ncbi:Gamma-tubulin complex component 3 [Saguinus oedipus]|uniref:Gamma-tubulin complex component 3 n=1 Tax=Saguinus oedipus TaxID=9490 RepID=A0ABQ9WAQ6_SAGOE|nr:Gamma-tubulin complex component 3 [Saguinus oedipus]
MLSEVCTAPDAGSSLAEFSGVLHQCHILASEMVHFIHQMQYYITFEVLECSWDELWNKVQQAQDLDHIIAAHEVFLDTIISRCLLDSDSRWMPMSVASTHLGSRCNRRLCVQWMPMSVASTH